MSDHARPTSFPDPVRPLRSYPRRSSFRNAAGGRPRGRCSLESVRHHRHQTAEVRQVVADRRESARRQPCDAIETGSSARRTPCLQVMPARDAGSTARDRVERRSAGKPPHIGGDDYHTRPGDLLRMFDAEQRRRIFDNIAEAMQGVPTEIVEHQLAHLAAADPFWERGVRAALAARAVAAAAAAE